MEELEPISVLDVVMALQRQGAIGQYRNSRSACPCFLCKWTSETCSQDTNSQTCARLMSLQWPPGADLADNFACLTMFCIVPLITLLGSICMSSVQMRQTVGCVHYG